MGLVFFEGNGPAQARAVWFGLSALSKLRVRMRPLTRLWAERPAIAPMRLFSLLHSRMGPALITVSIVV